MLGKYEAWLNANNKSPVTIAQYLFWLNRLPKELLLKPKALNNYLFTEAMLKPSELAIVTSAVRSYYKYLDMSPKYIQAIRKPNWKSGIKRSELSKEEVWLLLGACKSLQERLIVRLFLETGIRKSVLPKLTPQHVNFIQNIIRIDKNFIGNKGKIEYHVNISDETKSMLQEYVKKEKISTIGRIFIFYRKKGKGVKYKNQEEVLKQLITKIGRRVGLDITPNALRHTFGMEYYQLTKDIIKTRDKMGQKTTAATERYAFSKEEDKELHKKYVETLFKRNET